MARTGKPVQAELDQFTKALVLKLCTRANVRAKLAIKRHSKTLADACTVVMESPTRGKLYIPHYWAVYLHDGRGAPYGPNKRRFLVWFRNPKDDPRLARGYPVRLKDARKLTKGQFRAGLAANALNPENPPMIIRELTTKSTDPTNFFDNRVGMAGFPAEARNTAGKASQSFVTASLKDLNEAEILKLIL